jgi:GT2 family glycosyltransferase
MSVPETIDFAPVALFCYNRPRHLQKTVEALLLNAEASNTELYIFCDGPPNNLQRENTDAVRTYVRALAGFKKVTVVERETNFGLSRSIVTGVTEIVNVHGNVIVLEDDLVTSPYFLRYMNDGLRIYRDCESVASIHGYSYAHFHRVPETYFLKGADCYGWGTWKRAWKVFNNDPSALYKMLIDTGLSSEFDWQYPYPYMQLLHDQMNGKNDLWAVRWHASAFLAGMFTLYPRKSLVYHIGFDTGTSYNHNCPRFLDPLHVRLSQTPVTVELISKIEVVSEVAAMHRAYLRRFRWLLLYVGIRDRIYRILNRCRSRAATPVC